MTNQDIIVAKVFKVKYFPTVDFLEAQLGHNPSFIWRSIHASWVVVEEGLQWRIGDDNSIIAWTQPWLKYGENSWVSSNYHDGQGAEGVGWPKGLMATPTFWISFTVLCINIICPLPLIF